MALDRAGARLVSIIFISYRRDDSAPYAGRLYDRLSARFGKGQVFMDIDQIAPGEDFVEVIGRKVGACSIAVVLIGRQWLAATDADGKRRLDDPEDFVRLEVAAALQRDVRVVPVLVGGAKMPRMQQLPGPLATLSRRNAFEISDGRFHTDVDKLIEALEQAPSATDETSAGATASPRLAASPKALAIAGLAAVAVGVSAVILVPALRGGRTAAPTGEIAATPAATTTASPAVLGSALGGAFPTIEESKARERRRVAADPQLLAQYRREAANGSADSQYRLAVLYECGTDRNLPLATRWYESAAAQGHVAAREALAGLRATEPTEPKEREFATIRREISCNSRLQEVLADKLQEMDDAAKEAIRKIKPG